MIARVGRLIFENGTCKTATQGKSVCSLGNSRYREGGSGNDIEEGVIGRNRREDLARNWKFVHRKVTSGRYLK